MIWSEEGVIWDAPEDRQSTIGHVFGQTGEGPAFLMKGYLERGHGFAECMAKTAWTEFSGMPWSHLDEATRGHFVQIAIDGPKTLLQAVMTSDALSAVRH